MKKKKKEAREKKNPAPQGRGRFQTGEAYIIDEPVEDLLAAIAAQKPKTAMTTPVTMVRVLPNPGSNPKKGIKITQSPKTPFIQSCHIYLIQFC